MIDTATVKKAVTAEHLAEDMELELVELFPKHGDLRLQAVRLLMHLEESGPTKQNQLGELLGIESYAVSRLLAKLQLHRYILREREGVDKLVGLANSKAWSSCREDAGSQEKSASKRTHMSESAVQFESQGPDRANAEA